MAKLQFLDLDNTTFKDIATTDSPSFIGEAQTSNPNENNIDQIVNLRFVNKWITKTINSFNTETLEANSNCITGLVPGADYLINMYGVNNLNYDPDFPYNKVWADTFPDGYIFVNDTDKVFIEDEEDPLPPGYVRIGYFAVVDKANRILGKSDIRIRKLDWPNSNSSFPESITMRITAPIDGYVYGYMNFGLHFAPAIPVKYMNAVRVNDVKIDTYKASIVQQENQTVIVTVDGIDYKDSFTVLPGSSFTTRSEGYPGYRGGTVSPESGVFTKNTIFTVSPVVPTNYTATIVQTEHQTITVTYNGNDYTSTINNIPLNSTLLARITSVDYGYTAGRINQPNIKVKSDVEITATPAVPIPYDIEITQRENELIRVTCNDITHTDNFKAGYLERIKVSIVSLYEADYVPGNIVIQGSYSTTEVKNEYIVRGPITITATSVIPNAFNLTVPVTYYQTVTVVYTVPGRSPVTITSNSIRQTTVVVPYGTTWTAEVRASMGYDPGELSAESGTITGNYAITVTDATIHVDPDSLNEGDDNNG